MSVLHSTQVEADGIHRITAWHFADAAARNAATPDPRDIKKVAYQASDDTLWLLRDATPTWLQIPLVTPVAGGIMFSTASKVQLSDPADIQWDNTNKQLLFGTSTAGSATARLVLKTGTTVADGIEFGTGADRASLYRSAADTLKTDDDLDVASGKVYKVNGTQVVTSRQTGYAAMTGTANRGTAYDTATITLEQLAERVKAVQDDLTTHGLIGT
jgi:hypothetical protein